MRVWNWNFIDWLTRISKTALVILAFSFPARLEGETIEHRGGARCRIR